MSKSAIELRHRFGWSRWLFFIFFPLGSIFFNHDCNCKMKALYYSFEMILSHTTWAKAWLMHSVHVKRIRCGRRYHLTRSETLTKKNVCYRAIFIPISIHSQCVCNFNWFFVGFSKSQMIIMCFFNVALNSHAAY